MSFMKDVSRRFFKSIVIKLVVFGAVFAPVFVEPAMAGGLKFKAAKVRLGKLEVKVSPFPRKVSDLVYGSRVSVRLNNKSDVAKVVNRVDDLHAKKREAVDKAAAWPGKVVEKWWRNLWRDLENKARQGVGGLQTALLLLMMFVFALASLVRSFRFGGR
ncbi:hypothetical protein [Hyphomicrobium sp. CS1BSMeth3]|uniref:hypothetical protein n=1 Tax=Hyphomicrobium sp. CS1BSMeth3 TaxID=1892844 RepID=UPI000931305A|nr:hypothetical protein [Hyphomicrobium sp. CS1BSMeth3]